MLPVKSKFKIAKRLGAHIFEKTQGQKFALSEARAAKVKRGRRGGSDYGRQLLEKQKVRYTYALGERQLSKYAEAAFAEKDPSAALHTALETRLDSVIYAAGFAGTRRAARQAVSHGNFMLNGRRITIPSASVKVGDIVEVREANRKSALYASLTDPDATNRKAPAAWLTVDAPLMRITIDGLPTYAPGVSSLDFATVFEFYSR